MTETASHTPRTGADQVKPNRQRSPHAGPGQRKKRHPNYRLVKKHRNYKVKEISRLLDVHKNTVHQWIKGGLSTVDDKRPAVILGCQLIAFLKARRLRNKRHCQPGEMYCLPCRGPKSPAGGMVDYLLINEKIGNLAAICPDCGSIMHRTVSIAKLGQTRGKMDITFPLALRHLSEISQPAVSSDLRGDDQ